MVRVGWVVKTPVVLGLAVAAVETAPMLEGTTEDSPRAIPVKDPYLGYNAIFRPVPSCLSEVILVIYIQCLELLDRLQFYKDMYGPFVREVEFYVDGTWCDPRAREDQHGFPCYGPPLDRSILPEGVHVVDHNGGGWLMQRSLIDAIGRPRERVDHAGFLFIADDVLLNLGQLTRAVRSSGCDVIWRSDHNICDDVRKGGEHDRVFGRFLSQAREFSRLSDEKFNNQLARNLGTSSTYCMGSQNDFIYIPTKLATAWTKVAQQMTDAGLVFTYTFNTAIYGIAPMEDMVVLRTYYLSRENRSENLLQGATFHRERQPYCWSGTGDVTDLLSMHIIHPNKIAFSEKSRDFALTVNPSGSGTDISLSLPEHSDEAADSIVQATHTFAFWCDN